MKKAVIAGVLSLLVSGVSAAEIFVATNGDNSNPGTREAPLATLDGARQFIASRMLARKEPVTVYIADGVYYLPKTLVFSSPDSGRWRIKDTRME